jgi:hypothetical protein
MTGSLKKKGAALLLGLASLIFAMPVSAQVEKATVKIDGMI